MVLKKKSNLIIISAIVLIIGLSMNSKDVTSHAPSNLTLEYDFSQQELTANLVHSVTDMNTHYIFEIEIWKNDVFIITHHYTSQPSLSSFTYTYPVSADFGDILEVIAKCNQGGSQTKQITVTDNTVTQGVPAAHICIILIGISSTALIKLRRKG